MISNKNLLNLNENNKDFFWQSFNEISEICKNYSAIYQKDFFLYQKEYCLSNKTLIDDKSFIILNENRVESAGILFLTKSIHNNDTEINFGKNVPGLLLVSPEIKNNSIRLLKEIIFILLQNSSKIIFTTPENYKFNKGYQSILNNFKFSQNIKWIKSISTNKNKEILWKDIRKSYKSPINNGLKKQSFLLIDKFSLDREKFKLIQELHLKIAGRKTRSDKTWDLQFSSIKNDSGFAFVSFEEDMRNLNSAVYFFKSQHHAHYGTGLYTNHTKKNLYGYSIIWKAILYCIERGISTCELDDHVKFKWMSDEEKKLIDISFFKLGFGGDLTPRIIFSIIR
tara:strand:+ start:6116 stop:7132 length:1017 start_codon:yes stop_codon:yes gene_type:complete